MTNTEIVKALADKLAVKITIEDDKPGKCCVEEPPENYRDVYLLQKSSYLGKENKFRAYQYPDDDFWCIRGGENGTCIVTIPRSAMAGIRWVEIGQ